MVMFIDGKKILGVIDAGADMKFILIKTIEYIAFHKTITSTKVAKGVSIKILGVIKSLLITIQDNELIIQCAIITNNDLSRILIGGDTIIRNLSKILQIIFKEASGFYKTAPAALNVCSL